MRIVVVNNFFPPRVGGSAHLSDALARGYARRGHEVLVVTAAYQDAPAEEERDGIRIVRFPAVTLPESRLAVSFDLSFATRPSLRRRLAALLDDFRPDVIHQHGQFMDLTWSTGAYARRRGIPVLLSIHTRLENPVARYRHAFRLLDATLVAPRLRRTRPSLVVMDSYMQDYIDERYRRGWRDLVPIPVGVDPDWVRAGEAARGRELIGVDEDTPVILSVGHVIPLRSRIGLVEALPAILERHPDAVLAVVGRVYYDVFLQRAQELGVAHAVRSLGAVPKSDIPHLLAAARVESHEQGLGLGTATLESMAAGVPVVAWGRIDNFPGIPMVDGEDIYMCEVGDVPGLASRIIRALDDPEATREVGARARAVVDEHFAIERVLDRHLEVLEDLVAAPVPV
ncbi:glycosyltransferase family 4 protein [Nocardioides humi]|uniref:Glycosyltransferase family 4 protein n=1 Tax=Nocardioides humi TaxID=449461 RepID=A0ABN2A0X5_9ACTN|nr:glycosyltransferase family 4 protein [Nocardioides humi]